MKIIDMKCPNCGKNLEFNMESPITFCPYCSSHLYLDDEAKHVKYTKIDEARIAESNNEKEVKMKRLQMEEEEKRNILKFDKLKFNIKLGIAAIGTVLLIMLIVFICVKIQAKKQYDRAYANILSQIENNTETIAVNKSVTVDSATLSSMISAASELVTYKYFYTSAGVYEKSAKIKGFVVPFTTDKTIYLFDGIIGAGIDIEDVAFDVDNEKKVIKTILPQPKILSHEIDTESFRTYDVKNSVFTSSSLEDYGAFEDTLKKDQEDKLKDNEEFWRNVRNQAKDVISNLISASGALDEYKINFEFK